MNLQQNLSSWLYDFQQQCFCPSDSREKAKIWVEVAKTRGAKIVSIFLRNYKLYTMDSRIDEGSDGRVGMAERESEVLFYGLNVPKRFRKSQKGILRNQTGRVSGFIEEGKCLN